MSCVMFSCVEGGYYREDVIWHYRRDVPPLLTLHHLPTNLVETGTPEDLKLLSLNEVFLGL